jgi:hypothetical protein
METSVLNKAWDLFDKSNKGEILSTNLNDVVCVSNFLIHHGEEILAFDSYLFAVLLGFVDFGRDIFKDEILYRL